MVAPAKQNLYSNGPRALQPKRLDPAKWSVSFLRPMNREAAQKMHVTSRDKSSWQGAPHCTSKTMCVSFIISG